MSGWEGAPFIGANGSERSGTCRARVLVADDNADMRAYLLRILEQRYRTSSSPTS
jgi:hypothetical protein